MNDLIKLIEQWGHDRNIINGSTPAKQAMKLFSEFGELSDNVGDSKDIMDDVGDVFVVLTIITAQLNRSIADVEIPPYTCTDVEKAVFLLGRNLCDYVARAYTGSYSHHIIECLGYLQFIAMSYGHSLEECVQVAYNDIKDRKGILYNGVFIKESNPAYADAVKSVKGS